MSSLPRVDLFAMSDPDGRDEYQTLAASPNVRIQNEQTFLLRDGSLLRLVDYTQTSRSVAAQPIYTQPVC
jgi:hypothetical protein